MPFNVRCVWKFLCACDLPRMPVLWRSLVWSGETITVFLKPDECFIHIEGSVSIQWLQCIPQEGSGCKKRRFYHSFVAVWVSWVAESCRSRDGVGTPAETWFAMGKALKESSVVDSRRIRKTGQDAQDDVIKLFDFFMPFLELEKHLEFGLAKVIFPSFFKGFVASHCLVLQIANLVLGLQFGPVLCALWMFCHTIRLFCVGQAEGKKVLVQVLSGTAPRGTIRGRFFNRGLVRKWTRFLLLVWLIFFSNMARKVVDFQGLLLGAFFMPVFGPGLLTCAARVPIFGPKIRTPSKGQKHNSDCKYLCPLLWRPVALELWSGSMNVCWVVLPRKCGKIKSRIQEEWSQAASRYAPTQKRRILSLNADKGLKEGLHFGAQDQNPSWVVWTWIFKCEGIGSAWVWLAWKIPVLATECCVFGDFCPCWCWFGRRGCSGLRRVPCHFYLAWPNATWHRREWFWFWFCRR